MADATALAPDPLAGLVDSPLPPAIGLWPQTWTSRVTIAVLLALAAIGIWRAVARYRANAYRRAAARELASIERAAQDGAADTVGELALLLRRTALAAFPRTEVASLSGPQWLAFLDNSYGGTGFANGPGAVIGVGPYDPRRAPAGDVAPLIALVRQWISAHHD